MNNIQVNGQRRWGPPEKWSGPPPPHGTEVFIKNLPEHVFEQELYSKFSAIGMVYEVRLPVNWDGLNRGYAFVRFTSVREADSAIQTFDGYEIRRNRRIKVARSVDNTRLFLSAVPPEKNADDLKRDLMNYVENVKKVYVYPTLENRSLFRGYAFVEFETHRDAAIAKRILTPDVCYSLFEKKCVAAWANPLPFLDQSLVKSLNVLFMRNIPKDINGSNLKKVIENLIGGEEIKRVKKMNNFAFLTFRDHKTAERALHQLQHIPFLISDHETQVEWAIPREIVSSSFSSTEKEWIGGNDACDITHTGHEGSKMESACDRGRSTTRITRYSQLVNQRNFSESPDIILSTQRDIAARIRCLDYKRIFHCESGVQQSRQQENESKVGSLNSTGLAIAVPSNPRKTLHNLRLDSTSPGDLSVGSFGGVFSDSSFDDVKHPTLSSTIASVERNALFRGNCSPESKCSSPCSPLSSSAMTPRSSESPVRSPFFSDENDLFPSGMFEDIFFRREKRCLNDTKTNYFGREHSQSAQLEHFKKVNIL